jgi:hypothetical protein
VQEARYKLAQVVAGDFHSVVCLGCGVSLSTGNKCFKRRPAPGRRIWKEGNMRLKHNLTVETTIGLKSLDNRGSPVAVARMDPAVGYGENIFLIRKYIDEGSESVWQEIRRRLDAVYLTVRSALNALERETAFMADVKKQLEAGKKLLFKPNLVALPSIDPVTHGPNLIGCCSPWEFPAAVMRWFHEEQEVSYYRMVVGEAGNFTPSAALEAARAWGERVTPQALMEGHQGNHYGGWGLYFIRRYLAESRLPEDREDPMRGFEDSLVGHSIPLGTIFDKLLCYDLNTIADDRSDGRDIAIPDGINYKSITLHKAIVGGDPNSPEDRQKWPGCVLVNLPKLKIHAAELITCCIKNLGIGLYPISTRKANPQSDHDWIYGQPRLSVPCYKASLPHSRWVLEYDPDTFEPVLDVNGRPEFQRTGGIEATMSDMLRALQECGILIVHVAEAIMCTNINHSWPGSVILPEGFVFAGLDPVAVDTLAARYLFSMVPMEKAESIRVENSLTSDVIQKTPMPRLEGKNIVTGEGYDSAFSRYGALAHCEKRGLGQRRFYVIGEDLWEGGQLASVEQHLGRVKNNRFTELRTENLYHTPSKYHVDFQAMSFTYLKANDELTGSRYMRQLLEALDENGDGVIDYLEFGHGGAMAIGAYAKGILFEGLEQGELLRFNFLLSMSQTRLQRKEWNPRNLEIGSHYFITQSIGLAFDMSRDQNVHEHPLHPGRSYGGGMWPSVQYMIHKLEFANIYGRLYPDRIDLMSPFGQAFRYADLKFNKSGYVTPEAVTRNEDVIGRYKSAVKNGGERLPFTVFVPTGLGRDWNGFLLNVEETDDRDKMFTASFGNGAIWDKFRLSDFGY